MYDAETKLAVLLPYLQQVAGFGCGGCYNEHKKIGIKYWCSICILRYAMEEAQIEIEEE
jgi:hypothetical protein